MGSQPEARLSRRIQTEIRAAGHFCYKVHGSELTMAGLPDIIVCAGGLFIGLEVKMPAKRSNTSARQDYVHSLIRQAGGIAAVVCSPQEALSVIEQALAE